MSDDVGNIEITAEELARIRMLEDFDLTMLLSEINDHGWVHARQTFFLMLLARARKGTA